MANAAGNSGSRRIPMARRPNKSFQPTLTARFAGGQRRLNSSLDRQAPSPFTKLAAT